MPDIFFQYKNHTHWSIHKVLPKTAQHSYLLTLHFSYTEDDLRSDVENTSPETVLHPWGILFSSQWLVLDSFMIFYDRWYCIYSEFVIISILFISTVSFSLLILHTSLRRDRGCLSKHIFRLKTPSPFGCSLQECFSIHLISLFSSKDTKFLCYPFWNRQTRT